MILLAAMVAGCAGPPRWVWKHPGYSEQRTREDLDSCRQRAFQGAPGMPLMTPELGADLFEEQQDLIRRCMEAKGYHYESVKPEEK